MADVEALRELRDKLVLMYAALLGTYHDTPQTGDAAVTLEGIGAWIDAIDDRLRATA